ncbi:MAG TPA: copper amine oxidase N-terminal domain-containing protein [Caldisericia bacterium]|nr:copper amine oxidase N-terminal domain-containing protein [Caldisericia bacterium]HRV75673.1 copper amine oxidase N-terminal domain-containing protein [Caldisericia bacterium]
MEKLIGLLGIYNFRCAKNFGSGEINVELDVKQIIHNDRTMVPMRFLAESLGCEVEWIPETKEIILTYSP